ncbi:MAG: bifunctional (p)ppGpp synthetase/guanosine-3',5'-bis(diphosphate) 3'-pyrophosphohydrolase [Caldisericia bacterium]|nr:bifunctional (p)ppGpp synthetase/guanosine-3',5'-bis(diphosphate) 3'-pyrophosphohydrolase [Caldisericia bacterium]
MDQKDLAKIEEAYFFAKKFHEGQKRKSGEPYIIHPLQVAIILANHQFDSSIVVAGILHDSIEDTEARKETIQEVFGEDIADLVDQLTKLQNIEFRTREEGQSENLRKLLLAMAQDIRVVMIKIADRLHNMRTLNHLSEDRQNVIAKETMDIYVPLVHRLGMYAFKWELEDLSFKYINPEEYERLKLMVSRKREERESYIENAMQMLSNELTKNHVLHTMEGRPKNLYSTFRKMENKQKPITEVYDLFATRVLVDSVSDCYLALGIIHSLWRPVPGRVKDYIANPKGNGYKSLHTTIFGPDDQLLEIQIRTHKMHTTNEVGIANHWAYKEGDSKKTRDFDEKVQWLKRLLDMQQESKNADEFVKNVKFDLFKEEVFAFTPKGRVMDLPIGSTPIDFAYRIHTDVGNSCIGSKVNGRIVPLTYILQTGDIVKILTSKTAKGPGKDWIKISRSPSTRSKIRNWFRKNQLGNDETQKKTLNKEGKLEENSDDIEQPESLFPLIHNKFKKKKHKKPVIIDGKDDLLVTFPKCCNPVPYDEIVGYISRGRGIVIHRKTCPNLRTLLLEDGRVVSARWNRESEESSYFETEIVLHVDDSPGTLSKISDILSTNRYRVIDMNASVTGKDIEKITLRLEIKDNFELGKLIDLFNGMKSVKKVRRI